MTKAIELQVMAKIIETFEGMLANLRQRVVAHEEEARLIAALSRAHSRYTLATIEGAGLEALANAEAHPEQRNRYLNEADTWARVHVILSTPPSSKE